MKNNNILRYIFLTFCLIMAVPYSNAVQVCLTDGYILSGNLTAITDSQIYLDNDDNRYSIYQKDIIAVEGGIDTGKAEITVTFSDNHTENVILILLTADKLIYRKQNDIETLYDIDRNEIVRITVDNTYTNHSGRVRMQTTDTNDILTATAKLLTDISSDSQPINNIESSDFYDKYWMQFNGKIDRATGDKLWNLIDLYTDKEKSLTLIYNEMLGNDKDKTEIKMSTVIQELQFRIHSLRLEFARRAYHIVARLRTDKPHSDKIEISFGVM